MPRYQTEIVVPPDRYVCLQMPADFPEGAATVLVLVGEADPDRQEIEWWDEFEGEDVSPVDGEAS